MKPALKKHFEDEGEEPRLMSPAELTDFVKAEVARWVPVVRSDGEEVGLSESRAECATVIDCALSPCGRGLSESTTNANG